MPGSRLTSLPLSSFLVTKDNECFWNSEMVKDFEKRFPLGHWSFLVPAEEEISVERTITTLKDSGIQRRLPLSKKADMQCSQLSSVLGRDSCKRKVDDVRFTSALNLRTQSLWFAQFTLQMSRIGVMK